MLIVYNLFEAAHTNVNARAIKRGWRTNKRVECDKHIAQIVLCDPHGWADEKQINHTRQAVLAVDHRAKSDYRRHRLRRAETQKLHFECELPLFTAAAAATTTTAFAVASFVHIATFIFPPSCGRSYSLVFAFTVLIMANFLSATSFPSAPQLIHCSSHVGLARILNGRTTLLAL